jgi:hypothetical protein
MAFRSKGVVLSMSGGIRGKMDNDIRYLVHQVAFRTTTREVVLTVECQMAIRGNRAEQEVLGTSGDMSGARET